MTFFRLACMALLFLNFSPSANAAPRANFPVEKGRETFVSGGRKISVTTFIPAAPGRFPAVLVLHSSAGTLFGNAELERFSRSLAERGMVALQVRYFDRTGTIFAGDAAIGRHLHAWEATVGDALDFASAHPRVRRESIGIFGYSLGAFLGVSAASSDTRVDAVAELSGGIFAYLHGRLRRVPPTLILHGADDRRVAVAYARELEREARRLGARPLVKIYPGEGHVLSTSAIADASGRAREFLATRLSPPRR
jgi:carboxymethylenebutenolidase